MAGIRKRLFKTVLAACLAAPLSACGHTVNALQVPLAGTPHAKSALAMSSEMPRFIARNAYYRLDAQVGILLTQLDADLAAHASDGVLDPQVKSSYDIRVRQANVRVTPEALKALLNTYVFGDADAPLRRLDVSIKGDHMTLAGELHEVLWIPFAAEGALTATPDGHVRFRPTRVTAHGVPVSGLMSLGFNLAQVLALRKDRGITLDGNDFLLDVGAMLPAPRIEGAITQATLENGALALQFGASARALPRLPAATAANYIALWGGNVRLGGATLTDAKVQVCDADPKDPLMFALDRLGDALSAGLVNLGSDGRTLAYVPDLRRYDAPLGRFAPSTLEGIPAQAPEGTLR